MIGGAAGSVITVYLLIHFGLAVSVAIFALSRRGRPAYRLAFGRALIVGSILLPIAFHLVPSHRLLPIDFSGLAPDAEVLSSRLALPRAVVSWSGPVAGLQGGAAAWETVGLGPWGARRLGDLAILLWLTGFIALTSRLGVDLVRLRRLLSSAVVLRAVGRVRVLVAGDVEVTVPFSARSRGLSFVVVPVGMLGCRGDLTLALRHELQHHRQGDPSWALFTELLRCFFFFNPAIYRWSRELTELQELACDEAVVRNGRVSVLDYGACLVRVAETALRSRGPRTPLGTACMASGGTGSRRFKSFLQRRIEMLIVQRPSPSRVTAGFMAGFIGLASALGLVFAAYGGDQLARHVRGEGQQAAAPNPGAVVVDEKIQGIAERVLRAAVAANHAAEGFALVSDPATGRLLAVANVDVRHGKTGYWALSQLMEPASLSKALVAAEAIERGVTSPEERHSCESGNYRYGDRVYHDWKATGWTSLSTTETVANSSDICAMKIGEKLGAGGLGRMLEDFGFGPGGSARSYPAARPGQLPPPDDRKHPRLVPYVTSGFGYRSTPLEMLQAYGAIANGGNLMAPKPANALEGDSEIVRRVLSPESAAKMRVILRSVVVDGTAKGTAESAFYTTAGKTATGFSSGLMEMDWMGGTRHADVAQFIGFAPADHPRVEVYVGILDPRTDGSGAHGSRHAAPVFREIIEGVLKELKVAPDRAS